MSSIICKILIKGIGCLGPIKSPERSIVISPYHIFIITANVLNLLTMAFAFLRLTSEAFNSSFHGVSFAVLQNQVPFILPKLVIFTVFIFNFSSVKLVIQRTVIESKEEYVKPPRTSRSQGTIRFISNF